ncbi:NAD(P)-dependent dehydrogenase (short-subunit alcohol dehydrogenase family) [Paraburkholderia sp. CI2]|uniref:oxidoreductase n=1 Tax=Paraburkholderia sp. CI2 TaxID=2723093 RepID=UPI001610FF12|nr:oxidoreductase [Paraburkholderia sp. CI2]MBB5466759.1 NAD(P)-dependent dehydrogenase (short-subunit alcohol dehydrogenase family) [Paraburkholderia sp. CI2]
MPQVIRKTFFITGVSTGFGRAFSEAALADGHRVVGTLRNEQARAEFDQLAHGRSFGRLLDVTDTDAIAPTVAEVEKNIGPIDVLINNAGYGHEGTIEESPLEDLRRQFDVNVFGAVAVIKAVLPFMRERRSGHIINITSMGGLVTFPGLGYYNSSKFALEGLSEALAKEMKPFGIAVTAVEPGGFRTDWAGRSMIRGARSIADYDATFEPVRKTRQERSGKQIGDPSKAARAILTLVQSVNPPFHLLLGSDALGFVREKLASLDSDIKTWEPLTLSTDVDA